jgi:PII-like signaling protein
MPALDGEWTSVRVFIGDADKWHHQALDRAVIDRLRQEGFAGTTIVHGVAGYGSRKVVHTAHIVDLSADLPIVIEIVETDDNVRRLLPILDEMLPEGTLVTLEKVRVFRSGAHTAKAP